MRVPCRTPGCSGFETQLPEEKLFYCQRCGWPLAEAEVTPLENRVDLIGEQTSSFVVRLYNRGKGPLRWRPGALPTGLRLLGKAQPVASGKHSDVTFEVDATRFREPNLEVPLELWDKTGEDSLDFRSAPTEESYRVWRQPLPVRTRQLGPLVCHTRGLLYPAHGTRYGTVQLFNQGEVPVTFHLQLENLRHVVPSSVPEVRPQSREYRLEAGLSTSVRLWLEPDSQQRGELTITSEAWEEPRIIKAHRLPERTDDYHEKQWVVAIDFGTTKSAVMIFDQWEYGAEPESLLWSTHESRQEWYIPSKVRFSGDQPVEFGWQAGEGNDVLSSVKTTLQDPSPRERKAVIFLLERIYDRIAEVKGSELLRKAQIVLSLPVLDHDERAHRQRDNTLECALEAGAKYELRREQFVTYTEPECAMVDILHTLEQTNRTAGSADERLSFPKEEDWLCVVDLGGGTTDISLTQFGVQRSGTPEMKNVKVSGYGRAGDFIDQELLMYCLGRWRKDNRLEEASAQLPEAFSPEILEQTLKLKTERKGRPLGKVFQEVREAKEYIYAEPPARRFTLDSFAIKANHLELKPEILEDELLRPALQTVFEGQDGSAGEEPFGQTLQRWQIALDRIRFLFLTGGTSMLPVVPEVLTTNYLRSQSLVILPNSEPRKNVVRGAARRPSLKVSNMLPSQVTLSLGEHQEYLLAHSLPGSEIELSQQVGLGQSKQLTVSYRLGDQDLLLFDCEVALEPSIRPPRLMLKTKLEYSAQGSLELSVRWLHASLAPLFDRHPIAQIPKEDI